MGPVSLVTISAFDITPVLDAEFDEANELVVEEPPIFATRRCGGWLTRLDYEPEDE